MPNLDKSWIKYFQINSVDRKDACSQEGGAYLFQQRAVEELEKQLKNPLSKHYLAGLTQSIEIIKNLKP